MTTRYAKTILDEVGIDSMINADKPDGMDRPELPVRREDAHEAGEALHRRHYWPSRVTALIARH